MSAAPLSTGWLRHIRVMWYNPGICPLDLVPNTLRDSDYFSILSMAKGGARPGAGRPKGSTTTPRFRDLISEEERQKFVEFILDQYMGDTSPAGQFSRQPAKPRSAHRSAIRRLPAHQSRLLLADDRGLMPRSGHGPHLFGLEDCRGRAARSAISYGLDFGFDPDPAAVIAIYWYNGGFILDEKLYQTELLNSHLATSLLTMPRAPIVADGAEPKSIAELQQHGLTVIPCEKGKDSVSASSMSRACRSATRGARPIFTASTRTMCGR